MDELTAQLAGSFDVSHDANPTTAPHPRYSQYKMKSTKQDQESRRSRLLEIQKSRRFDFMNHVRKLTDGAWNDPAQEDDDEDKDEQEAEDMEVEAKKIHKPGRNYKNQLMMSEWLVEVPADFSTEWMSVLCPVARRCLVIAARNKTRAFRKNGYCMNVFPSHLPGGSRQSASRDTTILDCLYSEALQTYFIMDLMCWNGHHIYDSETEFRFYWLHEKLKEFNTLAEKSSSNPFKFVPLPSFRCVQEDIATAVAEATFEIDGLLFFHKRTHYTFGSTPLVVWLKPYMLKEILGISVPENQMTHMPGDYTNYADHMKKVEKDKLDFQKKLEEKKNNPSPRGHRGRGRGRGRGRHRSNKGGDMDVSEPSAEQAEEESVDVEFEEGKSEEPQDTNGDIVTSAEAKT